MEEMKMKGYKEERQQGIKEGYKRNQGGKKTKQRKETVPSTYISRRSGTGGHMHMAAARLG